MSRNIFARIWPADPPSTTVKKVRPRKPRMKKISSGGVTLKVAEGDFNLVMVEVYKSNPDRNLSECREYAKILFVGAQPPRKNWLAPDKSIKRLCRTYREAAKMAVAPQLENVP